MATFAIATLGCKVNSYESEGYIEGLKQLGYTLVDFKEVADIYIINTCAVTNTAASKSRQKIHQARKLNKDAIVCVVGCLIQTTQANDYDADIRIGSSGKKDLPRLIDEAMHGHKSEPQFIESRSISAFESVKINTFEKHTRAFLKVQDGCNQFCAYCIIPFARGKERSIPLDEAMRTAKLLVESGHKEIVLAGIHTGRYGRDINSSLYELVKNLLTIDGLERIRISSIEMNEISDEFLALMKENPRIARHLHIPIQSACNRTLKMMNRPYDVQYFINRVNEIRNIFSDISISTDIILGFPDEQEEDFNETLKNLDIINFSFMHIFPYSKRDGTKACEIKNHLNNDIKKKRCKIVSEISNQQYLNYKKSFINKDLEVLFEYEKDGYLYGHSSEYLDVMAKLDDSYLNSIKKVKITRLENGILYAD